MLPDQNSIIYREKINKYKFCADFISKKSEYCLKQALMFLFVCLAYTKAA